MILIGLDLALLLLLSIVWGIAGCRIGYLRAADTRLQSRLRRILVLQGIGMGLALAKIVTLSILFARDRLFLKDSWLVHLLLIGIPLVTVLIVSIPRVWTMIRKGSMTSSDRAREDSLWSLKLVLPVRAAGLGTSLDCIRTFFFGGTPFTSWNTSFFLGLFAVIIVSQWIVTVREQREATKEGFFRRPTLWSKHRVWRASVVALIVVMGISSWFLWSSDASKIPDRMSMMVGNMDLGGGKLNDTSMMMGHSGMNHAGSTTGMEAVSVTKLTGPQTGQPDQRFQLVAEKQKVKLASGDVIDAWTFNGQLPGPELRVKQGDLVEVKLINKDIEEGVTIHWHGQDVPNAEDGVSGVTQDAVMPGETYTYRFIAEQSGSYWYHSHQQSSEQVKKGLFGTLIVEPDAGRLAGEQDITVMDPTYVTEGGSEVNFLNPIERRIVAPGTPVRMRLFNTGNWPKIFALSGVAYKVDAIDGTEVNAPTNLEHVRLEVAAGGRYDVTFTMPDTPVFLSTDPSSGMFLSADGQGEMPRIADGPFFDPLSYGSPKATNISTTTTFDRNYVMVFDNRLGFYDGKFERLFTINGNVFPDTPMLMVMEGDLVKTTFVNRSLVPHPMHLHGHHMLVLSRNGRPTTGSPWWVDTLNVDPGESYEVAFVADNPGVWMDHCHNLEHAAIGMTLHLAYEGVTSPFEIGHASQNKPE